jgi:hypothetical protein
MIILAVVLVLAGLVILKRGTDFSFSLGIALFILTFFWVIMSGVSATGTIYQTSNRPLVALADGTQGFKGSFFLGSGSIGGGDIGYNFYMADADGAYQLNSVPAGSAKVVERSGPASIDIIQTCNYRGGGLWAFPVRTLDCDGRQEPVNYKFYVPKGSVISNYDLDASNG